VVVVVEEKKEEQEQEQEQEQEGMIIRGKRWVLAQLSQGSFPAFLAVGEAWREGWGE